MKQILFITLACLGSVTLSFGQNYSWTQCKWLIGDWVGEGDGTTGQGTGSFSLREDLSGKILVRKNHSEYPATKDKPAIIHDDLMIIYPDPSGRLNKAIYFDNEGHNINYTISYSESNIIFISEKTANAPIFRLTYTKIDPQTVSIKFEMSKDGEKFTAYTEGICKRME